jgi:hypothetical protein
VDNRSTISPGYLKPSRNHDTQNPTNHCMLGRTTFEEQLIFSTSTPDQDEEEKKKPFLELRDIGRWTNILEKWTLRISATRKS